MTRASALEQFGHSHQLDEWMYPSGTLVSIWTCEGMPLSLRLIYEGQLLSAQVKSKHDYRRNLQAIRKQLHPQLRDFWRRNHDSISTWGMPTGFGGILAGRVPYGDDEERAKGLELGLSPGLRQTVKTLFAVHWKLIVQRRRLPAR